MDNFRFFFAYDVGMFQSITTRKVFVVTCKRCRRDVPAGLKEFPFQSIAIECLCVASGGSICLRRCSWVGPTSS